MLCSSQRLALAAHRAPCSSPAYQMAAKAQSGMKSMSARWRGRRVAGGARRLVVLRGVAGRTAEERGKVVGRLKLLQEGGIAAVTAAAEERWFTPEFRAKHPERIQQRMAELLANDPGSYAAAYTVFATSDLGDRLADIRHPTLVA